ncbi:FecR domain-containing protein [Pedobacter steynii]|nr:FecR family protein [Pedobacter steynii]NQX38508.1 FecR domain-containing protein [Pedobacter steynii]
MNKLNPDLVKRYAEGACSDAEKAEVEHWLEFGDNDLESEFMDTGLEQEIWVGITEKITPISATSDFWGYLSVAAAACLILVCGFFLFKSDVAPEQLAAMKTYEVPVGRRVTLWLSDSSSVILAGGSVFRSPQSFAGKSREVNLISGEAFFSIAHNPAKPFIVHTSGSQVRVLGTKFNIENLQGSSRLAVTLSEGSIRFKGASGTSHILKPGQQLSFDKVKHRITAVLQVVPEQVSSWKEGTLWFEQTPLFEVIVKLEQYYGVRFKNPEHLDLSVLVTARFKEQALSRVLLLMENFSELKFKQRGEEIEIYKAL